MTKKENSNSIQRNSSKDFYRLSIQVSLNGLSFCILDTVGNAVLETEHLIFHKELAPHQLLKELQQLFEKYKIGQIRFSEVVVIHRNPLFSLVPKALFDPEELANYLKFNTRILANDHIEFDELEGYDLINVYVPFVNVNNYIYDLFGEFVFKHYGTVMVQSLLNMPTNGKGPVCYVHLSGQQMDITVLANKKLLLFNSFEHTTPEDFLYYLLFTLEQLQLDTETVALKLFGAIEEGDPVYDLCYGYVKHVSIFVPSDNSYSMTHLQGNAIDFTVLNAL